VFAVTVTTAFQMKPQEKGCLGYMTEMPAATGSDLAAYKIFNSVARCDSAV